MAQSIHGHDVMRKMIEARNVYSKEALHAAILEWFGAEARFHTCSAEDMTAGELIAFLAQRSKFLSEDGGFRVNEDEICEEA